MVTALAERRERRQPTPFGRRVRDLRARRSLSQKELAFVAGVDRSWLSLVELGEIDSPGADGMLRLADALDTTVEYLMWGREPQSSPDELAHLRMLRELSPDLQAYARRQVQLIRDALSDYAERDRPKPGADGGSNDESDRDHRE